MKMQLYVITMLDMLNDDDQDTPKNDIGKNALSWSLCCEAAGERELSFHAPAATMYCL